MVWKSEGVAGLGALVMMELDWSVMGSLGSRSDSLRLLVTGYGGESSEILRALDYKI